MWESQGPTDLAGHEVFLPGDGLAGRNQQKRREEEAPGPVGLLALCSPGQEAPGSRLHPGREASSAGSTSHTQAETETAVPPEALLLPSGLEPPPADAELVPGVEQEVRAGPAQSQHRGRGTQDLHHTKAASGFSPASAGGKVGPPAASIGGP